MKRIIFPLIVLALFSIGVGNSFAQGEAAAEFLLIAPGARAGGMGEANVAIANDATAAYWNPAGLAGLEKREFSIMHAQWLPQFNLEDIYYDFASYIHHWDGLGTFGLSATYLSLGEQVRTSERGDEIGRFSSYNLAIGGSYGTKLNDRLSIGVTLKYIYLKLSDFGAGEEKGKGNGYSVAADFGILYKTPWLDRLTLGANLSNMGPKIAFIDASQADPIPTNLKFGAAYKLLDGEYNQLTVTMDFNKLLVVKHEDGSSDAFYKSVFTAWTDEHQGSIKRMSAAVGAEYWYNQIFAIRSGYFYEDIGKRRFLTFGAGLRFSIYGFDFGYISADKDGSPLADTMRFSLSFRF